MKNQYTPTKITMGLLSLVCILIFACSKDFENVILDDFDFSFSGQHPEENFLFESSRTTFSLVPEKEISTVDYFLKYTSINAKGYFLNMEGDTLRQNDTLTIRNRNWAFDHVAIDTGAHRVRFTAWDSNLRTKELELLYNAKFASFSFLLNKGVNEFIINSKNPVNVTLLRDKETESPANKSDFEVTYQIENGTGKFYYGSEVFDVGKPFKLPKGISELSYLPQTLGEHKLIVTAKAPDGASLTEELLLNVLNLDFTINTTAAATQVELDTNLAIAIDLKTQDEESDVTYEITHSFSSESEGSGTVRDHNGGVMEPGQYRNILPNSYSYTFTSTELGKRKIYFDLRDSNGQTKRDSVEIEVANIPFTFSGNSESNSVFLNERSQFNFNIKSNGNTVNIEYNLTYEILEGNGRLTGITGNNIQNSTDYSVESGNFSLFYYPESIGSHQVSFLITDNYGQQVGPVIIDLETNQNDFQVNITPAKTSEFANIPVNVIIDIDEIPDGADARYDAFYSSGRNSSIRVNGTEYGPGEKFQLSPNESNVVYTGNEAGQHDIVLSVESDAGVTHTTSTTINYNQVDFLFNGGSQKSDISVGESISLNFNISESVGSSDYTMRFSLNGNALIRNESGSEVSAGSIYDVPKGNFNWSLEGTDESNINLIFYVQNDTGLEKTVGIPISVNAKDYNFTGIATQAQAEIGEEVAMNMNITEVGIGGDTYVVFFSSGSSNGSFEFQGTVYSPGEVFQVPTGSFEGLYTGLSSSNHNITFTARSSSGMEKMVGIAIEVSPKDYTFLANTLTSQAHTGDAVDINFSIMELGMGGDTYSMYFSSGGAIGSVEYQGINYAAGESFTVPIGSFQARYTGISESNHNIAFTVRSSSEIEKTSDINIQYDKYEELFDLTISPSSVDKVEDRPFPINIVTNAATGHHPDVSYALTFTFNGERAGYIVYNGEIYYEGETMPLDYGSTQMQFFPLTSENFNMNFNVENSTDISRTVNESITMLKKPKVAVKGEKHNINCGGLNGCDYTVRIYTCFDINCSEAYNGSTLQQVEIRVYNRFERRWDTHLFNYNDAQGTGVDRYFTLEEESSDGKLRYQDQPYEVRVMDTNGQWSNTGTGHIIRV